MKSKNTQIKKNPMRAGTKTNSSYKNSKILNATQKFIIFPGKNSNVIRVVSVDFSTSVEKYIGLKNEKEVIYVNKCTLTTKLTL